jgi:DNA-binding NtrC family response regulator
MARLRTSASELAKMLHSATQPIYVLDDEGTIVFTNEACQEWLGPLAEGLVGQPCAYHSSAEATGPAAVAAGLCPPPAVLAGREMTATVSCAASETEATTARFRRARFIPLGTSAEDLVGLVAILDGEDLPEPAPSAEVAVASAADAGATLLHEQVRRFRQQAAARYRADRLIGDSPAMRRARRQIVLAAGNRVSVLLVGPRGSGRQRAAAAIHYGSHPQGAGALVPLACSVLGADLIRSTVAALATGSALGGEAPRSTLLLNDADQVPQEAQADLATVLSRSTFPLRLIATAERPLARLVRRGKYREDLAAVLSTITIDLPPLAQRRRDLPLLAQLFLEEANARGGRQLGGFTPAALDALDAYPWPGNVEELAQVVAAAHRQSGGLEIGADDLPPRIRLAAEAAAHPVAPTATIVLDEFLARVERELIERALAQAKGNKSRAARLLGISRPRLYRRMVELGLLEQGQE